MRTSVPTAPDLVMPTWAVGFLRDCTSGLMNALTRSHLRVALLASEGEVLSRWGQVLVASEGHPAQERLEALYLLHGRVIGRLERGGVEDIARDVEALVRALLIDELQRATDEVVALL